jgi:hypothetical protein
MQEEQVMGHTSLLRMEAMTKFLIENLRWLVGLNSTRVVNSCMISLHTSSLCHVMTAYSMRHPLRSWLLTSENLYSCLSLKILFCLVYS